MFAEHEAAGSSPSYERLSIAVAQEPVVVGRLDDLPASKRQPNLLFAACRYMGAPVDDAAQAVRYIVDYWAELSSLMLQRSTQTNEPARIGAFIPLLARIDGPIALIEVGASAGLCLYPDRYRVQYDDGPWLGPETSPVTIRVHTSGTVRVSPTNIDIGWRAGIDLNPLDVNHADDVAWLKACVWPEHHDRLRRLEGAVTIAAGEPPHLVPGDLVDRIGDVLAAVPADMTPVVFHSAVLVYARPERRIAFRDTMDEHPEVLWISNEGPGVLAGVSTTMTPPRVAVSRAYFILATSGRNTVGITDPHGSWLTLA